MDIHTEIEKSRETEKTTYS